MFVACLMNVLMKSFYSFMHAVQTQIMLAGLTTSAMKKLFQKTSRLCCLTMCFELMRLNNCLPSEFNVH